MVAALRRCGVGVVQLDQLAMDIDVVSFHSYNGNQSHFADHLGRLRREAAKAGKARTGLRWCGGAACGSSAAAFATGDTF